MVNIEKILSELDGLNSSKRYKFLMLAIESGAKELATFFILKNSNEANSDALIEAAEYNQVEILKLLISIGTPVNKQDGKALRIAIFKNHLDCVKVLLDAGARISSSSHNDALITASDRGYKKIVSLLIEHGPDVTDEKDKAILVAAIEYLSIVADENRNNAEKSKYFEIIKMLVNAGADISVDDNCILKNACLVLDKKLIDFAIKCGASLDTGEVILSILEQYDFDERKKIYDIIYLLLESGINISPYNDRIIEVVSSTGDIDILKLFIRFGLNIESKKDMLFSKAIEFNDSELFKIAIS